MKVVLCRGQSCSIFAFENGSMNDDDDVYIEEQTTLNIDIMRLCGNPVVFIGGI
jgi:hypothetical protein